MQIEYNNLFTHFVLITKRRLPYLTENIRIKVEKYMTGIINNHNSKTYSIYANPEHIHILVSRSPKISEEELLTRVANATKKYIIENALCKETFEWQESAAAFSVSKSDVDRVCKYILNQPEHHKKTDFQKEHEAFIKFYQKTLKYEIR
jgi:putative transposase